ncbi:MAG: adenosine kinase [Dysgonamonadaceae bacterium]|jgi:sugar/nucleoside kinase (ribokinase family)|nr:adenosine kinase [Dysgonamonadaceae bacterium]
MKVLGIGNALVDILAKLPDDSLLKELNVAKGSMNLIDAEMRKKVFEKMAGLETKMTTGGSVSNTILALKRIGEPVGFLGKIGNDEYGNFYLRKMNESGVEQRLIQEPVFSGTALAMITPDGERTFCTYLGAAADMQKDDLKESVFEQYTHFYIEGYLVQNHELIETASKMARSLGLKTMIDLASFNVVAADREFIRNLVDNHVDIFLANEEEAYALTGKRPSDAIHEIAEKVETAIIKDGDKGSWVKQGDVLMHVPVYKKIKPIDTTAAGDYYAAGFFYGMAHNAGLEQCARLGSLFSYYIIQVIGTQLPEASWDEIRKVAGEIIKN